MLQVGDRVTISMVGTRWCGIRGGDFCREGSNPFGIAGTVIGINPNSHLDFTVAWDNGTRNSYAESDLDPLCISLENK
jgi:hypothetical protein